MVIYEDSDDFINKINNLSTIPDNAILVRAYVVEIFSGIPHEAGLKALRETLDERGKKSIPTGDLVKMAGLILKNKFFECNSNIKQQVSSTVIGTKFAPPYEVFHGQV